MHFSHLVPQPECKLYYALRWNLIQCVASYWTVRLLRRSCRQQWCRYYNKFNKRLSASVIYCDIWDRQTDGNCHAGRSPRLLSAVRQMWVRVHRTALRWNCRVWRCITGGNCYKPWTHVVKVTLFKDNEKLSYSRDSASAVIMPFKVIQGHQFW